MAQINWHQVNAHFVNALHSMQTGWGKVRDYVTRVEEPEWEFDPPALQYNNEYVEDDCDEDDEWFLDDHTNKWTTDGPPLCRSEDPLRYDAYYGE